jgi:S1-C subfamily serine protease
MADLPQWAFPETMQPEAAVLGPGLERALGAAVLLKSEVPEDAFTAEILGTERVGNGIVIGPNGLVLTIGYLVTEATSIWLTTSGGAVMEATPLAYDFATGFGLVQPLGRLDVDPVPRGRAADVAPGAEVFVIGHGGRSHSLKAEVFATREFAGYWEYVLDRALLTTPAHPQWGGTGLFDREGRLLGIGSLLVQEQDPEADRTVQGNLFVPIDLLEPILEDLLTHGQSLRPPRPWLGMYTADSDGKLVVGNVAPEGPAARAGVEDGDVVVEVAGRRPTGLADLFRRIWALGPAGVEVPLTLTRDNSLVRLTVRSADRGDFLLKPRLH